MPDIIRDYFVCIGAQKAGTTWLARMLARHPDLFLTPVKEIHFFDHIRGISAHLDDARRRSRYRKYLLKLATQWPHFQTYRKQWAWYRAYMRKSIDDNWYRSLFRLRGRARVAGEATPEYALIGRDGFEHIKRLAPDARVLYILRNPIERAWSQLLHHARAEKLDIRRMDVPAMKAIVESDEFARHGDYVKVIGDLDAVFDPAQIRIEFYEDIHADRVAALERICAFIGAGFDASVFPDPARRFNRSQDAPMPDAMRDHFRALYRPTAEAVADRLGRVPDAWPAAFGG